MRWIAAAGAAIVCWLALGDAAFGAGLARVTGEYLDSEPIFLTAPENDPRLFVAERGDSGNNQARIRIVEEGDFLPSPFLTIGNVDLYSERGLLSIAFAPDYANSGLFYAFYTAHGPDGLDPDGEIGDIRIVEYRTSDDPDRADPASARLLLTVPHSAPHHNGGWMAFGPDDRLYFSIGDDGERENAQNLGNLLGKVMRIDPSDPPGAAAYSIPTDNPFVAAPGARKEIYAYGLRNPFRASFTPDGRLIVGDVGESDWEEINVIRLKGQNLGWPECEGFCSPPNSAFLDPVFTYDHPGEDGGCAVVGGHVVEDPGLTGLTGRYIFSDFCNGQIRSLDLDAPGGDPRMTGLNTYGNVVSLAQDGLGCSYVLTSGEIYRIVGEATEDAACPIPPKPPVDPTYRAHIPARAVASTRLTVSARCSISCRAEAKGTVRMRGRNRRPIVFKLAPTAANLRGGLRGTLTMKIPARRVRAVKRLLRAGGRASARVVVTMTGADGSRGSGAGSIRLTRAKRR